MRALRAKFVSLRDLLATAWPIVLVSAVALYVAYQFVEPAPPKRMVVSTGSEDGAYHAFATRYAELLAHNGIELEIRSSSGSSENLERLRRGEADLAFVQGGIDDPARPAPFAKLVPGEVRLKSLGSVAYEPVWVFYRHDRRIDTLHPLAGKRLAVGEPGSGVRGVVNQLLAANGLPTHGRNLLPLSGLEAAEALLRGEVDVAFIVSAPEAAVVQALLHAVGVRVMSFGQAEAYARRFPFLSRIVLPRGVVDLERDIPPRDTALLATTANVVVRETLHSALASLLLQAMSEVNGQTGFFQRAGEFPAYKDRSYELSDDAQRYFKSGPPFLQRYLPFWLAVLVERLLVLIVPWRSAVELPTMLEGGRASALHAPVAARVKTVKVTDGQTVAQGDVLIELESPDLDSQQAIVRHLLEKGQHVLLPAVAPFGKKTCRAGEPLAIL